jgi:hypothetical protein
MAEWSEWKRQCAVALCAPATQTALREFALARFGTYLQRYGKRFAAGPARSPVSAAEAWHLFETRLVVPNPRGGKRYKDWLFARIRDSADDPLDVVQGGATLIMRGVVRDHLCSETSPHGAQSLHAPLAGGGLSLTLEDILPSDLDTAGEVEQREFKRLAAQHAGDFFDDMTPRERVALLARHLGISLAHPAVTQAAGCAKSMVNDALHSFVRRVTERLTVDYANDDKESVRILCLLALESTCERVAGWGFSEKSVRSLFLLAGRDLERRLPGGAT